MFEDTVYNTQETRLEANQMLFLYTDGLTEAKNIRRKEFTLQRVEEVVKTYLSLTPEPAPQDLLDKMQQAVRAFVQDAEQSDDLTMLALRYTPQVFDSQICETLTLTNDISDVSRLGEFIKTMSRISWAICWAPRRSNGCLS